MSQKEKTKFRASAKWKKFRNYCKKTRMVDEITLRPLRAGWNLHHLNLNECDYTDISDEKKFLACNKLTHSMIHDGFRYYKIDKDFAKRLVNCWELMLKYSNTEE